MRAVLGAIVAGVLFAVLVLVLGVTATAWLAIAGSVAAIVYGCRDYVKRRADG